MVELNANAMHLLEARYLLKKETIETPEELFQRVAKHVIAIEEKDKDFWFERFNTVLKNLEFLQEI